MLAISLKQPYATLVANGKKKIECRSWKTEYRGPLLICSSKTWSQSNLIKDEDIYPLGKALCVVTLLDCLKMDSNLLKLACIQEGYDGNISSYGWLLENPKRIKPFDVKGKLGLYEISNTITYI